MSRIAFLLNRFADAFKARGIPIKRTQILEIAADAFGYRNSNELAAAAKAGDINPPVATPIGRLSIAGHDLIAFIDPATGAPFATPAKEGDILIAPPGGLVSIPVITANLPALATSLAMPADATVTALCIIGDYNEIVDLFVSPTKDGAFKECAEKLRQELPALLPHDHENPDIGLVEAYCECLNRKFDTRSVTLTTSRTASLAKPESPPHTLYVLTYKNDGGHGRPIAGWSEAAVLKEMADELRSDDPDLAAKLIESGHSGRPNADRYFIEAFANKYDATWTIDKIKVPSTPQIKETATDSEHLLKPYRVTLVEEIEEDFTTIFECAAEDESHAVEQARNAYRGCKIVKIDKQKENRSSRSPRSTNIVNVHIAEITHRHGTDILVAASETALEMQIAGYCRDSWRENADEKIADMDADQMSDADVIALYATSDEESIVTSTADIDLDNNDDHDKTIKIIKRPADVRSAEQFDEDRSPLTALEWSFAEKHNDHCRALTISHGWAATCEGRPYLAPTVAANVTTAAKIKVKMEISKTLPWRTEIIGSELHVLVPFADAYRHYTSEAWQAFFLEAIRKNLA